MAPNTSVNIAVKRGVTIVIAAVLVVVGLFLILNTFEYLEAEKIMVVQSWYSGHLDWFLDQGVKPQWFGHVTKYDKRKQFWFSEKPDEGKKHDQSIEARFNDGGKGWISGSLAWEMPIDIKKLDALHQKYGSVVAIESQLIRPIVDKAIYMTGPLMSSMESYASRRNELLNLIDDQIVRGVFKTESYQERMKDPMTGIEKTVTIVKIIKDSKGLPMRQDASPLEEFGIRTFNLSINKIKYDKDVEGQITAQQNAFMQVVTAVAQAKEAEQKTITVAKQGEALAATEKWKQEAIKAKAVTEAEQNLAVAELKTKTAEQYKRAQILEGEGDAAKKRLIMEADGALQIKIEAYKYSIDRFASAMEKYQGNWVPLYMSGGASGQAPNAATQMMELLSLKAAKDLGIDLSVSGKSKTAKGER